MLCRLRLVNISNSHQLTKQQFQNIIKMYLIGIKFEDEEQSQ